MHGVGQCDVMYRLELDEHIHKANDAYDRARRKPHFESITRKGVEKLHREARKGNRVHTLAASNAMLIRFGQSSCCASRGELRALASTSNMDPLAQNCTTNPPLGKRTRLFCIQVLYAICNLDKIYARHQMQRLYAVIKTSCLAG